MAHRCPFHLQVTIEVYQKAITSTAMHAFQNGHRRAPIILEAYITLTINPEVRHLITGVSCCALEEEDVGRMLHMGSDTQLTDLAPVPAPSLPRSFKKRLQPLPPAPCSVPGLSS